MGKEGIKSILWVVFDLVFWGDEPNIFGIVTVIVLESVCWIVVVVERCLVLFFFFFGR